MIKRLFLLLLASAACASAQTTVFFEDFSGSSLSDLNGTAPDIRPGSETWSVAPGSWQADGSITGAGEANAFLSFSPTTGQTYTLSIDANPQNGTGDWFALGFAGAAATNSGFQESSTVAWMLLRGNRGTGGVQTFLGPDTNGGTDHDALPDTVNLKVVLDTTATQWTAEWFINGTSIREETFSSNPNINYVGFGRFGDATGTVDNFALTATAVPEPSTYALGIGAAAVVVAALRRRKPRSVGAPLAEPRNT